MVWDFSEGLARVQLVDGRGAFINRDGKVQFTLDKAFQWVSPFADGMAEVRSWAQPGGYQEVGYIDRTGKLAIPQMYQSGSAFHDGIASVAVCGQSGYITKNGEPIWGIKLRASGPPAESAPSPSTITPELVGKLADHPDPLTLQLSPGSGTCDPYGKKIWSLTVHSTDRSFPGIVINLLEGGTFLSQERIDALNAAREKLKEIRERFKAPTDLALFGGGPIGSADHPNGYVMTLGLGPGGSDAAASVFSPDREYEVQVVLSQGGYARPVRDPLGFASKIALGILSILFGQTQ
jgi:hypothetical protein